MECAAVEFPQRYIFCYYAWPVRLCLSLCTMDSSPTASYCASHSSSPKKQAFATSFRSAKLCTRSRTSVHFSERLIGL